MSKTIILDIDGTLTDFMTPYVEFLHKLGHTQVDLAKIKSFYFLADFGFGPEESKDLFYAFVAQGGFRNLKFYPGAITLLAYLKQEGYQIVLATNVPSEGQQDRLDLLKELGVKYDAIHFTPDKHKIVNQYGAHLILEDHPDAIEKCLKETNAKVAAPRFPYNSHLRHENLIDLGEHPDALTRLVGHLQYT